MGRTSTHSPTCRNTSSPAVVFAGQSSAGTRTGGILNLGGAGPLSLSSILSSYKMLRPGAGATEEAVRPYAGPLRLLPRPAPAGDPGAGHHHLVFDIDIDLVIDEGQAVPVAGRQIGLVRVEVHPHGGVG